MTNNDQQNTTQQTETEQHESHLRAPEMSAVCVSLVTPVVKNVLVRLRTKHDT